MVEKIQIDGDKAILTVRGGMPVQEVEVPVLTVPKQRSVMDAYTKLNELSWKSSEFSVSLEGYRRGSKAMQIKGVA